MRVAETAEAVRTPTAKLPSTATGRGSPPMQQGHRFMRFLPLCPHTPPPPRVYPYPPPGKAIDATSRPAGRRGEWTRGTGRQRKAIMPATLHHVGVEHLLRAMAAGSMPDFAAATREPM